MSKSFAAPPRIHRIAARRVFKTPTGKPVVLTIGVRQPVPGSDWGCALQITGMNTEWRRPRYVFGIDALEALHLAMQWASRVLGSAKLEWPGQTEFLGLPKFLPMLPQRSQQDRLEAMVESEAIKFWGCFERAHKAKASKRAPRSRRPGSRV